MPESGPTPGTTTKIADPPHSDPISAEDPLVPFLPTDWRIDRDVPCPVCRYNLRGRREARCPECGAVFCWQALVHVSCARCGESLDTHQKDDCQRCHLPLNWPALLESATVIRRSLYEYSNRPRWAFVRTLFGVLRPWHFWRGFALEMPPNLGRLRAFRRVTRITALMGLSIMPILTFGIFLGFFFGAGPSLYERWLIVLAHAMLVPFLVSRVLPRFTPTIARFRIRSEQLTRCTTYLTAAGFWLGAIAVALLLIAFYWGLRNWQVMPTFDWRWTAWNQQFRPLQDVPTVLTDSAWWSRRSSSNLGYALDLGIAVFAVWQPIFLFVALRRYLRLNALNAAALAISSLSIACLLPATLYVFAAMLWLTVFYAN